MSAYTKSFEVRKRIYANYDDKMKPIENADFEDYANYLLFANLLLITYRNTKCLKYFSCLLKVDDTLLSVEKYFDNKEYHHYLSSVIRQELEAFFELAKEQNLEVER